MGKKCSYHWVGIKRIPSKEVRSDRSVVAGQRKKIEICKHAEAEESVDCVCGGNIKKCNIPDIVNSLKNP